MSNRRDGTPLDQYVAGIKERQRQIEETKLAKNYIATQQSLDGLKEGAAKFTDVEEKIEEIKKTRGHTKEVENTESEILLTKDLYIQKKRCLETLLYVAEIENLFQNVQSDIEDRALYLSKRPKVFQSVYRGQDIESQTKMHKECVYTMRESWSWLQTLTTCVGIHTENAATYHQFYHDVQHLEEDMSTYLQWMDSPTIKAPVKTKDPDDMLMHFKLLMSRLLDYQSRVDRLTERSREVHPVHYRKELPEWPVKAKALVKYEHKNVSLEKDEFVTVLDNSDTEKWMIRTSSGTETEVPAIVLVIPPPDPTCFQEINTLREQMHVNSTTTANRLRSHLMQFLSLMISQTQSRDLQGLSSKQKSEYMKMMNDATDILPGPSLIDPEYDALKGHLIAFRKLVTQITPGQKDLNNIAVQKWNKTKTILRLYSEVLIYSSSFLEECNKKLKEETVLITDLKTRHRYTSNAYFQRVIPTIEIDTMTKETRMTQFKAEMYIHERHRGRRSPKETQKRRRSDQVQAAQGEDTVDGIMSSSYQPTVSSVKNFAISGVLDPKTKQKLSISQALSKGVLNKEFGTYNNLETGETMPIAEAISKGLISVEYGDSFTNGGLHNATKDSLGTLNSLETKTFAITGVVDPKTGQTISAKEAITSGLLDNKTGKFRNPVTGEELSLLDAVRAGYLMADPSLFDEDQTDSPMYSSYNSIVLEEIKYKVRGVINPATGEEITLKQAIRDGIIDPVLGVYKNPQTGEVMSIEEATKRGFIKGRPFDTTKDRDDDSILTYQQLQVKRQTFKAGESSLVNGQLVKPDPNEVLLDKLREKLNTAKVMVIDPKTGKPTTLEEAIESGFISLTNGSYKMANGETISLMEACVQRFIEPDVLKEIMKTYQEASLANLINSGQFDPDTGLVTDPSTGKTLTLQAAIDSDVINPDSVFFYDMLQNRVLSLAEAIESGRLDKLSGKIVNPKNGERLSVTQAEATRQICSEINPEEITERAESLTLLRGCMDTSIRGIKIPNISDVASVEEAVTQGTLQLPKTAYVDEQTVGIVPLQLAVQMERVEPNVALALFSAFDKHSLEQEIGKGSFNPKSGMYVNPKNGEQLTIDDAKKSGLWNPYFVFLVDQETGNITSLGALADKGKFEPKSGKYISDTLGKSMSINEAIAQGLILPHIEAEKYVDTSSAVKDLIDSGKVNPRTTNFVAANDLKMSLRDALANGFLTMGSKVKIDPETGDVYLVSDEAVVQSLIEVKEQSDWLSDVAQALASQGRPSEKLDIIKRQAEDCLDLKEEISRKEPELKSVISHAEQLILENAKIQSQERGQDKAKDEAAQQFQKLKSSATDLKVRLDMVSSEADNRSQKLTVMGRNLEELYYQMEEIDQWLDSAIEKTQDLQSAKMEVESQYNTIKEFVEEVKEREDDLSAIVKSADSFKENAQDVEKDADSFRKRIDILPTIREEGEMGVLDEELESIEAKFKDISKECAKHMERLGSLAKQKKIFDDLHDKLSLSYPSVQEKLNSLVADEDFGLDPQKAAQERENLRNIKSDLISQERKLKDLAAAGERLIAGLIDSGMNEEAEEVQELIALKRDEHQSLLDDISEHEQLLDAAVVEQQNVLGRLDGIEANLREAEAELEDRSPISLDKEKLAQQIQEQRLVNAKIASSRTLLERLCLDVEGSNEAEDKLRDLMQQAEALEDIAEQRNVELEDVLANIAEFEAKSSELDGWLNDSVKVLKPAKGAPKPTRTKVDSLHEAKKEKEGEMEALRQICNSLSESPGVKDNYALKETLADVETKWNDLTELLVQQMSLEALSEIDGMLKYLDKAENVINTAEPVSIDPETLGVQLREHKSFDDDLKNKRNAVKEIIDKCTRMLRETANSQTDEIKFRLDSITSQADIVCQLSAERLQQLEAALPLATHYGENQTEVSAWLEEMEAEMEAQGDPGQNLEQVKKQHDNLKTTQQIIEDHKLFIDDLNSTGLELMDVCAESDAVDIQNKLLDINKRYEGLKSTARGKARDLTDAKRKFTQEAADTLDHLLDELDGLHRIVSQADPIPASPDKLKNEIDENRAILEDLDRQKQALVKAEEMAKNPKAYGIEDPDDAEDLKQKFREICDMSKDIRVTAEGRDKSLKTALKLAEKFYDLSTDVMSGLRDLKDSMYNHEPPGIDPDAIKEQQGELAGMKKELEKARELVGECRRTGSELCAVCGESGAIEVQKQLEDLVHMTDDVNDTIRDRGDELRKAFQHADQFKKLFEAINSWLPLAEHKLALMKPPSTDPNTLQTQIEELKAFKADVHPHISEMQQLNQEMSALRDSSPIAAESLQKPVKQANEKWSELLRGLTEREGKLTDMQLKVGEVSQAMNDVITSLEDVQKDLSSADEVKGDPKFLETHMRKLQLAQADLRNKEKSAKKLSKAVDEILQHTGADPDESPLQAQRQQMKEELRITQATAREKENKLQESMRQVKKFMGDLDDQLAKVNEFRAELKTNQPYGALPDTSEKQYAEFVIKCQNLDDQERKIESLLTGGQQFIDQCKSPQDVQDVADKVKRLRERWADTKDRARKRKEKMEEHLGNVSQFHDTLKVFTDWLNSAEISMRTFKYPSKLVGPITKQIEEHNVLKAVLEAQAQKMSILDRSGTYLKYFGRKQDTIYVKNMQVGIRLRWKKLLRRADERGRLLEQAYREDKRFDDSWRGLCDWLDQSMQTLSKFMSPANQPAGMKQDIDELKRFNIQLTAKHPTFFSTTRLGRNLKDRCVKADPEREVLNQMLEDLKNKWNAVRSVVSKSQNKLDEALLTSGRVSDALQSLLEWLQKAEAALDEEAPILGDLDTVHMLIEQHRNIQQELAAREATVLTMRAPGNLPPGQSAELSKLWDRVNRLCDIRESKLKEGLRLAEEFQDVVTVMREFLPQAEAQLKFRALPEDEMVILQLIEKHEKFQEDLRNHQESVDKIKGLAEEILLSCHPNAVRFVKYYLTITQTRWDQLLQRASNRGQRLQEALRNIQGNAALLEELLAWLTDAQALLATKERDPIPDDLKVVETLLKEHLEFHDEVTSKNNDAERLSKLVISESKMSQQGKGYGSNMKLNEFDGYNPRVIALQNKWRTVWHMSVDRKKRLQDAHDTLLELESFKSFDFDLWRTRYLNWIQAKKFRITDFFRRQDKDSDGFLDREEFVGGMLKSKFPTNRTELNAVFEIFDSGNRGVIEYKNFVDALKADKRNRAKNNNRNAKSDVELIHEEIEKELSSCQCRHAFRAEFLEEGKYRFGEKQKTCLVRFLNHTVMVRVGGGWVTLEEFVEQNDPCKAKGRTNFDLRETLALSDGTPIMSTRRGSASGRTSPFPTGVRRRANDTGYASSNSSGTAQNQEERLSHSSLLSPTSSNSSMSLLSPVAVAVASPLARSKAAANRYSYHGDLSWEGDQNNPGLGAEEQSGGSNDSSLRRSRVTSSMVNLNLASAINSPAFINSPLGRSSDTYGSTGNLNRTKRLSTSSSNITGRKTPTSLSASGKPRSHIFTTRATTPTVAFGSSVRSRPTTPTFSPHSSSTPQRPGSATPTKGLGPASSGGPSRQRRLPNTPRMPSTPTQQSSQGFR
ncbi:unnamed protein product [Lymnaea stagnalis]|uniref:Dystonin n=1 Tax=Lymnaea stagnalis TaxID=6523 RepID=A0AAV2HMF6_LYMST